MNGIEPAFAKDHAPNVATRMRELGLAKLAAEAQAARVPPPRIPTLTDPSLAPSAARPPEPLLTKREDGGYLPAFTPDELRCIHRDISTMPWQPEKFYVERRAVLAKLDAYFGDDHAHLRNRNAR